MTDSGRWEHVKRLFHNATALDTDARDEYLQSVCRDAPEVLAEVRSLLEWDSTATDFLESPLVRVAEWPAPESAAPDGLGPSNGATQDAERDHRIGSALGAWRITAIIGRGGMGTVYRAERADEAFQRLAAIKVVRVGRESASMIERFRRERETLASLDHANIARLLDGGATADGQPYFVMELVDGVPIDRSCDEQRLSIDRRLDLFAAVCAGVQYAHENLVIHRDIKPDNILVTHDGTPKLLDFGIARLLSDERAQHDEPGMATTWLMTPDYASPEQVFGRTQATLASDVYSLGVLLYVLLTGVRPYHLAGTSQAHVQDQLRTATLRPPSARVLDQEAAPARPAPDAAPAESSAPGDAEAMTARATDRRCSPRSLSRRLSGDLDAIVLRALGREPTARYSTVDQLALDIAAHRSGRPVTARGRDVTYLARTFVRRHAVGLALLAGVALLTVAGMGAIMWQANAAAVARSRAEHRFDDVRRLAHTFMFDVHDAVVNIPGTTSARMLMVKTAVDYLERLASEATGDRDLQRELAGAFVKIGDAQGNPSGPNVGDSTGALASYRRAIGIAEPLARAVSDDVAAARTLALAHRRAADVLAWRGDLTTAMVHGQMSARLFTEIAARSGPTFDDRVQAGIAQLKLGDLTGNPNLPNLGKPAEADTLYAAALATLTPLAAEAPTDIRARRYLGITYERIGTLHEQARRYPQAAAAYRQSFEIRRALSAAEPAHTDIQRDFAIAYEKIGNIERFMNDPAAATASYRGSLARFEQLAARDPSNTNAARSVAISQERLSEVLVQTKTLPEARALLTSALHAYRTLSAQDADNAQARCDVGRVAEALGDASRSAGRASADSASPGGASAASAGAAACSAWQEALRVRDALDHSGAQACVDVADVGRLKEKLRGCS